MLKNKKQNSLPKMIIKNFKKKWINQKSVKLKNSLTSIKKGVINC